MLVHISNVFAKLSFITQPHSALHCTIEVQGLRPYSRFVFGELLCKQVWTESFQLLSCYQPDLVARRVSSNECAIVI